MGIYNKTGLYFLIILSTNVSFMMLQTFPTEVPQTKLPSRLLPTDILPTSAIPTDSKLLPDFFLVATRSDGMTVDPRLFFREIDSNGTTFELNPDDIPGRGNVFPRGLQPPPPEILKCLGFSDEVPLPGIQSNTAEKPRTLEEACERCDIDKKDCNCKQQVFICAFLNDKDNSSTVIGSFTTSSEPNDPVYTKIRAVIQLVASCIAVVGNLLVILVTLKFLKQETRCNKLIALLAFSDLIFAVVQIVVSIPMLWTLKWLLGGEPSCKIVHNIANISISVAIGFLLIISIERYLGIVHPHMSYLTSTRIIFLTMLVILISVGTSVPSMVYLQIDNQNYCWEKWPSASSSLIYTWFDFIIFFFIPLIIISYMYITIIQLLKKASKLEIIASEEQKLKRIKANKRIMKVLISILIAFVVLTLPNRIAWLVTDHIGAKNLTLSQRNGLTLFGFIPYSFHVAINPIIYSILSIKFRNKAKSLFVRKHEGRKKDESTEESATTRL